MPDGVEGFLTRKIGPLPLWAYLGVAGGAVILFVLYRRGQSASSAQTSGALAVPSGVSSSVQGVLPPSPPNPPSGPAAPGQFVANYNNQGIWLFNSPAFQPKPAQTLNPGVVVQSGGPAVTGAAYTDPLGNAGSLWQPVVLNGQTYYAFGPQVAAVGAQQGLGGGSSVALFGDGVHVNAAKSLSPHMVTQYVSTAGMGGGPGGRQRHGVTGKTGGKSAGPLRTVHERTGASMLRLISLNPGFWRPGSGQPAGRVRVG